LICLFSHNFFIDLMQSINTKEKKLKTKGARKQ
jgi:hypothetical protein